MNVLDKNIPRDQADLLRQWNVCFRAISRDLGYHASLTKTLFLSCFIQKSLRCHPVATTDEAETVKTAVGVGFRLFNALDSTIHFVRPNSDK